jgi:hypothetical protein
MDLGTLKAAIGDALARPAFDLEASKLGAATDPVPALLATLFRQPSLQLSGAGADLTGAQPSVHGTLAGAPASAYGFLTSMGVVATFSLDGAGTAQVLLVFTPASKNYGLADALPYLKTTVMSAFAWRDARFSFDTAAPATLPTTFPAAYNYAPNSAAVLGTLRKGMSFEATVSYTGTDTGMTWVLGAAPIAVSGPIESNGSEARFDLASAQLGSPTVGPFTLPMALHFVGLLTEVAATPATSAQVMPMSLGVLSGTLGLPTDAPSLAIPFCIEIFTDPPGQVTVVGRFASASRLLLHDVAGLLGVASLESQQPTSDFPVLSGLSLQTVALTVDLANKQFVMAAATLSYVPPGGAWEPFGTAVLTFDGLTVAFYAIGPLASPTFSTVIDATLGFAGGTLDAQIDLPALTFACELAENAPPIDLTKLLGSSFGGSFKVLCTALKVLGDPKNKSYRLQATVDGSHTWGFSVGTHGFELESIGFDLTIQSGSVSAGQIVAELDIAKTTVQISATYAKGDEGWTFSGGTEGVQAISLTDLVGEALALFDLSLPATAPQVTITDLQMTLSTGSKDFGFSCDGTVEVMGKTVDMGVDIGRTHDDPNDPSQTTLTFHGYLTIGDQTFTADFTSGTTGKSVKFEWDDTQGALGFEDIATYFGYRLPVLPEGLDLGLKRVDLYYDFNNATVVVSASSTHGQVLFASRTPQAGPNAKRRVYLFALDVRLDLELSDLPVVGDKLPAGARLGVKDLQVIASSASMEALDVTALNVLIVNELGDTGLIPASVGEGLTFAALLQMGSATQSMVVPLTGGGGARSVPMVADGDAMRTAGALAPTAPPPPPAYQAGAKWFDVEKNFGPVSIARIGLQYQQGSLFFLLDASLALGPLSFSLEGLGIGSALTSFTPKGTLTGLAVSFSSGPITIEGGLLSVPLSLLPPQVEFEYTGAVTIEVSPWSIAGVASYARVSGSPSFFLFAQVTGAFGGPPAFFVTGFMGGFGYNSRLSLPAPDQVYQFPFVAGLDNPSVFPDRTPMGVLKVLSAGTGAAVTPVQGEDWIAAGIMFRSFELVLGKALLVVEFGREFELALLGEATMSLPQGSSADAYAYVQLELEALVQPAVGYFGIVASLTPASFLLTKDCRLTGGFAFCMWFGPSSHAGDFVVSVGGYHPAFVVPAWYPQLSQVGFNWQVDAALVIKGGAYFALTPSAIMAGAGLQILFQSGCVKAWFIAYANMLIEWKPFHFKVGIGITLGASVRLDLLFTTVTITLEIGATLNMWGPPLGGLVTVHLFIISFSIPFGTADGGVPELKLWSDFATLLPHASGAAAQSAAALGAVAPGTGPLVLGVNINRGLARRDDGGTWYVRGDELIFSTSTNVPATGFTFGSGAAPRLAAGAQDVTPPAAIQIRPMGIADATSTHAVSITILETNKQQDLAAWTHVPQASNLPEALWGAPLPPGTKSPAPSSATVHGLPTGVQLIAPPATAGGSPGPMDTTGIIDALGGGYAPLVPARKDPMRPPVIDPATIGDMMTTLGSDRVLQVQKGLLTALADARALPPSSGPLADLGRQAGRVFTQAPMRAV